MGNKDSLKKKIGYSLGANLLNLFVSLLTTLIVPKFLGAEIAQYGYFQIYLFYVSYVGFFHFGLCDGIYLRDAGKKYEELDKPLYSSQFWIFFAFSGFVCCAIFLIMRYIDVMSEYRFVLQMVGINVVIYLPRSILQYYLQTTNQIKEYAQITVVGRLTYAVLLIAAIAFVTPNYHPIVFADIIGKGFALIVSMYLCRDIISTSPSPIHIGVVEIRKNISVGIKLLFANIASMLITGIVRWGIEQKWDVETYAKASFSLSVSQFLLTFISAVALVLYPTLRRTEEKKLPEIYSKLRAGLMLPLLGSMIAYYPMEKILSLWLPQYSESMRYMAILFPICIFTAKMSLLIQTYMNVFRMEKKTLLVNTLGVILAIFTTLLSVFVINSLTIAMVSIVINQMFRCILAEYVLTKHMEIRFPMNAVYEVILALVFIVANWNVGGWSGVLIYTVAYIIFCIYQKNELLDIVTNIKGVVWKKCK